MENILEIYENEKELIKNILNLTFINFGFDKQDYIIKNNIKIKKLFKELDDGYEISFKEIINKNYSEKKLEICKYYNKKDYEKYKIIINNERVQLFSEKYKSNKKINLSKQYSKNYQIIYSYFDDENKIILHENKKNLLGYIDMFDNNKLKNNVFILSDNVKYFFKIPYSLIYDAIIDAKVGSDNELNKLFELENKKRKSINSKEITKEEEDNKIIENYISKINLVKNNTSGLYNNIIDNLLKSEQFNYLLNKEIENKNLDEKIEDNEISNYSDLEILFMQKKELIEIKNSTSDIIKKLKNVIEKI